MQVEEKSANSSSSSGNLVASLNDQELSYASQAANEFNKNSYDGCLSALNKLKSLRCIDVKILLNHAVAEYYQSGLTKTDQFKAAIQNVRAKVTNDDSSNNVDEEDFCFIHYNYAVLLFHSKQYSSAISILEKVWLFKENLDEVILGKIFCLLMDLYTASYQPYKALGLAESFEKDLASKIVAGNEGKESSVDQSSDKYTAILAQQRLKCYMILSSIDQARKEVKLLIQNAPSSQMLKANFELLKKNHQRSIYMLTSCMSNWKKTKYLNICCNNNIAMNYFDVRKFNLAHLHMAKAVEESSTYWKSFSKTEATKGSLSGVPLDAISNKRHYELLYNMGVTLLHCGQPLMAFECLLNVVQVYQFNPRLWLRLAECSVQDHKASNDEDCEHSKKMQVLKHYAGSSVHRKGVLGSGVYPSNTNTKDSSAIPMPTLGFASLCLENALNCLDNIRTPSMQIQKQSLGQEDKQSSNTTLFVSTAPSNPAGEDEINNLRCSILTLKAYIALYHKNFLVALNAADSLLRQPNLSRTNVQSRSLIGT